MTRDDVVEAMAKARWNHRRSKSRPFPGLSLWDDLDEEDQAEAVGDMSSALSALESLGIALVPVEPSGQMVIAAPWAGPSVSIDVYRAMLSASPLRKTEGGEE